MCFCFLLRNKNGCVCIEMWDENARVPHQTCFLTQVGEMGASGTDLGRRSGRKARTTELALLLQLHDVYDLFLL